VRIMPPEAFKLGTASSTVGVVLKPKSTTSTPKLFSVELTSKLTKGPDIRASLPITTTGLSSPDASFTHKAYPVAKRIISGGVRPSPGAPPMVPLIPEIDLINIITK
jgi:hypothetical protein